MRFKQYLQEELSRRHQQGPASLQKIDAQYPQIKRWVETHAPKFFKQQIPIYRGVNQPGESLEGIYNTRSMNRLSLITHNYYNLWIDNDDIWRKMNFPKRSKSLIASLNFERSVDYAAGEHGFYYLIPKDGTSIGVCPEYDIWYSFKDFPRLNEVAKLFHEIVKDETNWNNFVEIMKDLTIEKLQQIIEGDLTMVAHRVIFGLINNIQDQYSNVFEYLHDKGFNPKFNDFEVVYAGDIRKFAKDNREVWLAGDIMMVKQDTWEQLQDDLL